MSLSCPDDPLLGFTPSSFCCASFASFSAGFMPSAGCCLGWRLLHPWSAPDVPVRGALVQPWMLQPSTSIHSSFFLLPCFAFFWPPPSPPVIGPPSPNHSLLRLVAPPSRSAPDGPGHLVLFPRTLQSRASLHSSIPLSACCHALPFSGPLLCHRLLAPLPRMIQSWGR